MKKLCLVGCGKMAIEYSKVLNALNVNFDVVGRSNKSAEKFEKEVGKKVITGGLDSYIRNNQRLPELAINAVGVEELPSVTNILLDANYKKILVENVNYFFSYNSTCITMVWTSFIVYNLISAFFI